MKCKRTTLIRTTLIRTTLIRTTLIKTTLIASFIVSAILIGLAIVSLDWQMTPKELIHRPHKASAVAAQRMELQKTEAMAGVKQRADGDFNSNKAKSVPAEQADLHEEAQPNLACERTKSHIALHSVAELVRQINARQLTLDPLCLESERELKANAGAFYQNCHLNEGDRQLENIRSCEIALRFYKAAVVDQLSKDRNDFSNLQFEVLQNKFLHRLVNTENRDLQELREIANEAKRLDPEHVSTYRMLVSLEIVTPNGDLEGALALAEQGLAKNPNDEDLYKSWLYLKLKKKDLDFRSYSMSRPRDANAQYFFAAQLWKSGQLQEARAILKNLVAQNPGQPVFSNSLAASQTSQNSSDPIFGLTFTFDDAEEG